MKAAIRSYRASESGARDLISTVWNVLDQNLEGTASIINALVDLLDEEDKKKDILQAWNGFKVEVRCLGSSSIGGPESITCLFFSATKPIPRPGTNRNRN